MGHGLTTTAIKALNDFFGWPAHKARLGDSLDNALRGRSAQITAGDEAGNAITVSVQLQSAQGDEIREVHGVEWWLSDSEGEALTATAPTSDASASAGVLLSEFTPKTHGRALTDETGALAIVITQTAATNYYFNVLVDGNVTSSQVSFAG